MKALGPNWRETIEGRYSPCRQPMTLRTRQLSYLVMVVSYLCLYVLGVTASCFAEPLKLMVFKCVTAEMWNFTKISCSQKSPYKIGASGRPLQKIIFSRFQVHFYTSQPIHSASFEHKIVWAQKKNSHDYAFFIFCAVDGCPYQTHKTEDLSKTSRHPFAKFFNVR